MSGERGVAVMLKNLRKRVRLDVLPSWVRLWAPALIGIGGMLALGMWAGGIARFLLFTHHLFYLIAIMFLINPVFETFWPSKPKRRGKRR